MVGQQAQMFAHNGVVATHRRTGLRFDGRQAVEFADTLANEWLQHLEWQTTLGQQVGGNGVEVVGKIICEYT